MWTKVTTWLQAEKDNIHKYWMIPCGIILVLLTWTGFIEYILHGLGTAAGLFLLIEGLAKLKSTPK